MPSVVKKGDKGTEVRELQKLLVPRGYPVAIDGDFGPQTYQAVRAFQSQNLDQHGQPLVVDGIVGPLTWRSLRHGKPYIETPSAVDYAKMPPVEVGGSKWGRAALKAAIGELRAGAREIGGNNRGKWVRKYLDGRASEGNPWCAAFVSWCHSQNPAGMPFAYTLGARKMLGMFKRKGWRHDPRSGYGPQPGDIVVWWTVKLAGWPGHMGLVHQVRDGMLYTIEGNKGSKGSRVQGVSYVLSRMTKLLGYGHVPDEWQPGS